MRQHPLRRARNVPLLRRSRHVSNTSDGSDAAVSPPRVGRRRLSAIDDHADSIEQKPDWAVYVLRFLAHARTLMLASVL